MTTKYTVVNTYPTSTESQKEKARTEASVNIYRELLRYAKAKTA